MLTDSPYQISIRNGSYKRIGLLDIIDSFECEEHHLALGSWVLQAPFTRGVDKLITTPGSGITVRHNGRVVFSGPMVAWERSVNGVEDTITIEGFDDMAALALRVVHPEPLTALPGTTNPLPQTTYATSHDTHSGPASTILYNFISRNAGPAALTARRYPGLTMAPDPATGPVFAPANAISGRFQNLLTRVADIARANNMTVRVKEVDAGGITVSIYPNRPRPRVEISSESETLQSWTMRSAAPSVTAAWAGGTGEGTDRTMVYDENPPPTEWPLRAETFLDQRNVDGLHELETRIMEEFSTTGATTALDLVATDSLTSQYGVDFDLGDVVYLRLNSTLSLEQVTSSSLHIDSTGAATRTFRVGPEDYAGPALLFDRIRRLGAQVNNSGAT